MIEMQGQTNPQKGTDATKIREMTDNLLEKTLPGSKTAAIVAGHRFDESQKPEGERICYDPYAVHFISPEVLELSKHPERAKAMLESLGDIGILLQAMSNSVRARVRYFDDFVKASLDRGLEQLVILGAGYDTRAHRIEGLNGNGCIKVFEADHPATQAMKIDKVKEIFGSLPDHVVYVPVDLATEDLGRKLLENGYDRSLKTLFIMEGLLMYLLPETVDRVRSFISKNSGRESSIIFDYYPQSVVDGSSSHDLERTVHDYLAQIGESLKFGIEDGTVETFLEKRGFSQICNVTSQDYRNAYFHGANKDRDVCSFLSFAHAMVE